jgi:hypothetical protein
LITDHSIIVPMCMRECVCYVRIARHGIATAVRTCNR